MKNLCTPNLYQLIMFFYLFCVGSSLNLTSTTMKQSNCLCFWFINLLIFILFYCLLFCFSKGDDVLNYLFYEGM